MKKIFKLKRTYILLSFFALLIAIASVVGIQLSKNNKSEMFHDVLDVYSSSQYTISGGTPPESADTIEMSTLYDSTSYAYTNVAVGDKWISISTAKDLYAFSVLCKSNPSFLGYKYVLTSNIEYSGRDFIPIGVDTAFTGQFDGNGYEIKNLKMIDLQDSDDDRDKFGNIEYFAMFSKIGSTGIVRNFGLIFPTIAISIAPDSDKYPNFKGIATVFGSNEGTVEYIYVNAYKVGSTEIATEKAGMYAVGGHCFAGLGYKNSNKLNNCYVAYKRVVSSSVTDAVAFHELLMDNASTNTTSNLFYYNASIDTYKAGSQANTETVKYVASIGKTFTDRAVIGTYCSEYYNKQSPTCLVNAVYASTSSNDEATQGKWHYNSEYPTIEDKMGIETPTTKSISWNSTTKTFRVLKESDFVYVMDLMKNNPYFASSDVTYSIECNLNLSSLPVNNYSYTKLISAKFVGVELSSSALTFTGGANKYPTIFTKGLTTKASVSGVDAYGVFPYFGGTIENLNFYYTQSPTLSLSSNVQSIGLVSGYADNATFTNVNVYGNVTLPKFTTGDGKFYYGGIVGIAANNTIIQSCTAAGTFDSNTQDKTLTDAKFDSGISVGGIVGYTRSSMATLNTCLSDVDITMKSVVANSINVGGILGSGYTKTNGTIKTEKLQNDGAITISGCAAQTLYVSGVVGRQLGIANEIESLTNNADITIGAIATSHTYASGVTNVHMSNSSSYKERGKIKYRGSGFSNNKTVIMNVSAPSSKVDYSNVVVIDALTDSGVYYNSKISMVYNEKLSAAQEINMNNINEYAPVVKHVHGNKTTNTSGVLEATTIYNLRSYTYTLSSAITSTTNFKYTGVILGEYIDYTDVRNEGLITVDLNAGVSAGNLYVSGVADTISNGCTASHIYNGGDISVTDKASANIGFNIYASGIIRQNLSVISNATQNPLNANYDNTLKGSLDTAINNGNITITTANINKDTDVNSTSSNSYLTGSIYAGGISYYNTGIISNTFNLGNISMDLFAKSAATYNAGGIACYIEGDYAQIRDCANNGQIKAINMSSNATTDMNIGGIVALNTPSTTNNKGNIKEVIAFTINYGKIICFNGTASMTSASITDSHAKSAGILANGACNVVNVVNYGFVYSSECAGSITGIMNLANYDNEAIYLANTLNYGEAKALEKSVWQGANHFYVKHSEVEALTYTSYGTLDSYTQVYQFIGSMFSIINFANRTNINVRYVINFFNGAKIVFHELNTTNNINVDTFITTNGSTDTFNGKFVKYAPLSTIEDDAGNIGVFCKTFVFRQAIDGIGIDADIVTDSYISDYFQFIIFDKINSNLLETIGWRSIAYSDASTTFARNLSGIVALLNKANITSSSTIVENAMNSNTWLETCDALIVKDVLSVALDSNKLTSADLQSILSYILFDSSCQSSLNSSIRASIVDAALEYYKAQGANYYDILEGLLYDELLARVIQEPNADYVSVLNSIRTVISSASQSELETVLENYKAILLVDDSNAILSPIFNEYNDYYSTKKMDLITTLITGYSDDVLTAMYNEISSGSETSVDGLKYQAYLKNHTTTATELYATLYTLNSTSDNTYYYAAINQMLKKYDCVSEVDSANFSILNMADNNSTTTIASNDRNAYINGTKVTFTKDYTDLWNTVKNEEVFQTYLRSISGLFNQVTDPTSSLYYNAIIAKATEFNNTYQSQDSPSGVDDNGLNTTPGRVRARTITSQITNRYIYTPDIVNNIGTYYYGPFMPNGQTFASYKITQDNYFGRNIYDAASITDTTKSYVSMFISTSETIVREKIASSGTTATNKNYYPFYWNNYGGGGDPHNQWVSDYILDNAPSDGGRYLYKNYTNGEYVVDYYNFSPSYQPTTNSDAAASNTTITYNGSSITLNLQSTDNQTKANPSTGSGDTTHPLRDYYLTGYCTSSMITGLWSILDIWKAGSTIKGCYLTSKGDTISNSSYTGIQTTQYTYYQMSDLVKLDGIRTKGKNTGTFDQDETSIISALMTTVLSTNAGKKAVVKAIANHAKSNTISNRNVLNMVVSSLKGTDVAKDTSIDIFSQLNETSLTNIRYSNTQNLKQYLDSLLVNYDFEIKDSIAMLAATDLNAFKKILAITLYDIPDNGASASNSITSDSNKDASYFLYKYVDYLKSTNPTITDSEIVALINQAKASDLTAFASISNKDIIYDISASQLSTLAGGNTYAFYRMDLTADENVVATINGSVSNLQAGTNSVIIPAGSDVKLSTTGTISNSALYGYNSITTGTDSIKYVLSVTFANGNLTINNVNHEATTSQTFEWELDPNTTYSISSTKAPTISASTIAKKNEFTLTSTSDVVVTFTGSVTIDGTTKTTSPATWSSLAAGTYGVTVTSGTTISNIAITATTTTDTDIALPNVTYAVSSNRVSSSSSATFNAANSTFTNSFKIAQPNLSGNSYYWCKFAFSNMDKVSSMSMKITYSSGYLSYNNSGTITTSGTKYSITSIPTTLYVTNIKNGNTRSDMTVTQVEITYTLSCGLTYVQNLNTSSKSNITGTTNINTTSYSLNNTNYNNVTNNQITINNINAGNTYSNIRLRYTGITTNNLTVNQLNKATATNVTMYRNISFNVKNYINLSALESAYNTQYANLSPYADYLASGYVHTSDSNSSVTIEEASFVMVYASGTGSITLDGIQKSVSSTPQYYGFYLSAAGTYSITATNATVTKVLYTSKKEGMYVVPGNSIITYQKNGTNTLAFYGTTYTNLSSYKLTADLSDEKLNALMLLFPTMYTANANYTSGKEYYIFDSNNISTYNDDQLKNLIIKLTSADYGDVNSSLGKLILGLDSSYYDDILLSITNDTIIANAVKSIWNIASADETKYSDIVKVFLAAYVGDDYLTNIKLLTSSKMKEILANYTPVETDEDKKARQVKGYYNFIGNNETVNSERFIELIGHLGLGTNIDGYGIYALSSSKGIGNGIFIPDNFDLGSMDPKYDENLNHTSSANSSWRGGSVLSSSTSGTVNYAFYHDMKQLVQSIATNVFELDLTDGTYTYYSSEELIDAKKNTITYYVPSGSFTSNTEVTIDAIRVAASASNVSIAVGDKITLKQGTNADVFTVTAEDTSITASYSIILMPMDISFDLELTTGATVDTGEDVIIHLTSPASDAPANTKKLPQGFGLVPYVKVYTGTTISDANLVADLTSKITFSAENNVNYVNATGEADIQFEVLSSLPKGTYTVVVNIYGTSKSVTFAKNAATTCTLLDVSYDGNGISFVQNATTGNYEANTNIPFGRAFDKADFLLTSDQTYPKYLDYAPTVEDNATYTVAVEIDDMDAKFLVYRVTYTVTAEDGITNRIYVHTLTEENPVSGTSTNLYVEGDNARTEVVQNANSPEDRISRDEGASYTVEYPESKIYTAGANVSYSARISLGSTNNVNCAAVGGGLSIEILKIADAMEYNFEYTYTNTGTWDSEYTRTFVFPVTKIFKTTSKDATLHNLTFLDSYKMTSGLSTVILPNTAMLPVAPTGTTTEVYYQTAFGSTYERKVALKNVTDSEGITDYNQIDYANLGDDYSTIDTSNANFTRDFFILGSIADAQLENYAPVFKTEDHAKIYQYTTLKKLTEYGGARQTKTDTAILADRTDDTIYLYVPFTNAAGNKVIYLVELSNGTWTNVYTTSFDGTNGSAAGISLGSLEGKKATVLSNGYYVDTETEGKSTGNPSLYMDYIGTPKENHFWYVSYIVFAEDYLQDKNIGKDTFDNPYYKCYHISLIDLTNNIIFKVDFKSDKTLDLNSLFFTLSYNYTTAGDNPEQKKGALSGYANKDQESRYGSDYYSYSTTDNLQSMPNGYYYFYVDLPEGYSAKYTISKANQNTNANEPGAYYPPSSIVTQVITLTIEIYKNTETDASVWGLSTDSYYNRLAVEDVTKTISNGSAISYKNSNVYSVVSSDSSVASAVITKDGSKNTGITITGSKAGTTVVKTYDANGNLIGIYNITVE